MFTKIKIKIPHKIFIKKQLFSYLYLIDQYFKSVFNIVRKKLERKMSKLPEFGWWIEIVTSKPICVYYFGVFDSADEARFLKNGYIEDLKQEQAAIINVDIKQCQPKNLTITMNPEKIPRAMMH